jgi:DnaJ-related protein SCJ1
MFTGSNPELFIKVQRAHSILSDFDMKAVYDMQGLEGVEQVERIGIQNVQRTSSAVVEMKITLEQIYNGGEQSFSIDRQVVCRACRGTGAKDAKTTKCKACGGKGSVVKLQEIAPGFNIRAEVTCDKCHGTGQRYKHKCDKCHGNRIVNEPIDLNTVIEKGVPDEHQIVFERKGQQNLGQLPGHIIVKLKTEKHKS